MSDPTSPETPNPSPDLQNHSSAAGPAPEEDVYDFYVKSADYLWWEQMREHLKERYFPFALFFDIIDDKTAYSALSPPIYTRQAKSGWTIYEGEDYVLITPGETAFVTYGHRKLYMDTINELCEQELATKEWITTVAEGATEWLTAVAWVLLHRHPKVETTAFPLTELADQILVQCKAFEDVFAVVTAPAPRLE